jgi:hypothetical protein
MNVLLSNYGFLSKRFTKSNQGTSVLEVLIVIALLTIITVSTATIISVTINSNLRSAQVMQQQAAIENLYGYTAAKVSTFKPSSLGGLQEAPVNAVVRNNLSPRPNAQASGWGQYLGTSPQGNINVTDSGIGQGNWEPESGNQAYLLDATSSSQEPGSQATAGIMLGIPGNWETLPEVEAGKQYAISADAQVAINTGDQPMSMVAYWYDSNNNFLSKSSLASPIINGESRVGAVITAPSQAAKVRVLIGREDNFLAGDRIRFFVADFMVEQATAVANYADGNSPGWRWDGASGTSTSSSNAQISNLSINPSVETDINSWTGYRSTITRSNEDAKFGSYSVKSVSTTTASSATYNAAFATASPVNAGQPYTGSFYAKTASSGRDFRVALRWYNSGGNIISDSNSAVLSYGSSWSRISVSATAPAGATKVGLVAWLNWNGATNGQVSYVDGMMIQEGSTLSSFGDGSFPGWEWNGAANNSASSTVVNDTVEMIDPVAVAGDQFVAQGAWGEKSYCYRLFYVQRLKQIRVAVGEENVPCQDSVIYPKRGANQKVSGGPTEFRLTNPADPLYDQVLDALPDDIESSDNLSGNYPSTVIANNVILEDPGKTSDSDGPGIIKLFTYYDYLGAKINFPKYSSSNSNNPIYSNNTLTDSISDIGMQTYVMPTFEGGMVGPRYFSQKFAIDQPLCRIT